MRTVVAGTLFALSLAPGFARAQADERNDFVRAARVATERYRDQSVALADGYRPIGPDFPSMGEHWLSIPVVVQGMIDPLRPPILEYVTVDRRAVLAGVAYTQLVTGGVFDSTIPAPRSAWHFHEGSVDEESFVLTHARGAATSTDGPRVAVLHAWLWLENPGGLFATDNWALPWYRLGLPTPSSTGGPTASDLGAALAGGGAPYFLTLLRLRERLDPEATSKVNELLERHGRELRGILRDSATIGPMVVADAFGAHWSALASELREVCPGCSLWEHSHTQ